MLRHLLEFLHNLGVSRRTTGAVLAHVVAVEHVHRAFLSRRQRHVRMRAGLIGKQQHRIVEIQIVLAEIGLVPGSEPVRDLQPVP